MYGYCGNKILVHSISFYEVYLFLIPSLIEIKNQKQKPIKVKRMTEFAKLQTIYMATLLQYRSKIKTKSQ